MSTESFAEYLSGLDEASLIALLQARPDARAHPVPRGFTQLAQRLSGPGSLNTAICKLNRDSIIVGQAIAALGASAAVPSVALLLSAPEQLVHGALAPLLTHGLAWNSSGTLHLPEPLEAFWSAEIGGSRPVAKIARSARLEDLQIAAQALGTEGKGLRKQELSTRLAEVMADPQSMVTVLTSLPQPARNRLNEFRAGYVDYYSSYGYGSFRAAAPGDPTNVLIQAGLLVRVNNRPELPKEVAVAAWLGERELALTGQPDTPQAALGSEAVRPSAQAAAHEALRVVAALLDEAHTQPIVALKKGGVGPRERSRLAAQLSTSGSAVALWIDLAYSAGLLNHIGSGYAPTDSYPSWRGAEPGQRWAVLADAWFSLEHAPTNRQIDGDKELAPPLPLASAAGAMRRALLIAARSGASVRETSTHIDWFYPLHGYDAEQRELRMAAAVTEAELLGVVASDVVTELGGHLVMVDTDAADKVSELAKHCAPLLPEAPCTVILQSDLTAVVSGQPSIAVSRLLAASAASEARGAAGVWRFSSASVRSALDAGWKAEDLLSELGTVSHRAVPQPLEYLINDAARRHGRVRVQATRCCVVAEEAVINEILHTRSLNKLNLSRLAPTVASSPSEPNDVLSRLRAAGFSPVAQDADGVVIVETRHEHQAGKSIRVTPVKPRSVLSAADLAEQLAADPSGKLAGAAAESDTFELLAKLNPRLDDAELELLCDAVDNHSDVLIAYRDNNGNSTVRTIQPQHFYGKWLDSWCHLRNGQRDFAVANIQSVAPVR